MWKGCGIIKEFESNVHMNEVPEKFRSSLIARLGAYALDNRGKPIVYSEVFEDLVHLLQESFRKEQKKIIDKIGLDLAAEEDWQNKVLEAPHYVMMGEFTSTAVNLIVSGKTQPSDQWSVIAEMRRRILDAFEREAIAIGATPAMAAAGKKAK